MLVAIGIASLNFSETHSIGGWTFFGHDRCDWSCLILQNYDAHFCDGLWPFKTQNRQIFQDWGYCLVSNKARCDSTSVILFQTTRWVRRDCQTEIDRQHRLLFSMPPVPVMMTLQHKVPVSSKISFQNVPDINVTISFCSFWLFKPSSQLFEPWQVQSLLDVWNGKICLIMLVLF